MVTIAVKEFNLSWDEIKLLQGFPGKEVVLARRNGEDWFIGGLNGEDEKKVWEIDLSFLGEGQTLEVIGDGATRTEFATRRTMAGEKVLVIDVLPKGGFVARTVE